MTYGMRERQTITLILENTGPVQDQVRRLTGACKHEEERTQQNQYRRELRRVSHTFGNRHYLLQRGNRIFIELAARLPKCRRAPQQTSQ